MPHTPSQSDQSLAYYIEQMSSSAIVDPKLMHYVFDLIYSSLPETKLQAVMNSDNLAETNVAVLLMRRWISDFKAAVSNTKPRGQFESLAAHWQLFWALLRQKVVAEKLDASFVNDFVSLPMTEHADVQPATSARQLIVDNQRIFQSFYADEGYNRITIPALATDGDTQLVAWYEAHEESIQDQLLNEANYTKLLKQLHIQLKDHIKGRGLVKGAVIAAQKGVRGKRSKTATVKTQLRKAWEKLAEPITTLDFALMQSLNTLIGEAKKQQARRPTLAQPILAPPLPTTPWDMLTKASRLTYHCVEHTTMDLTPPRISHALDFSSPEKRTVPPTPFKRKRTSSAASAARFTHTKRTRPIEYANGSALDFLRLLQSEQAADIKTITDFKDKEISAYAPHWKHFYSLVDTLTKLKASDLHHIYGDSEAYNKSSLATFKASLVTDMDNFNEPLTRFSELTTLVDELQSKASAIQSALQQHPLWAIGM